MTDDVRLVDTQPRNPRRVVAYGANGSTYRGVSRDDTGRPCLIVEARDVASLKLDYAALLERNETIHEVICTPSNVTASITYSSTAVIITASNPVDDAVITIETKTTFGEVLTERVSVRLPRRAGEERRIGSATFVRGVV